MESLLRIVARQQDVGLRYDQFLTKELQGFSRSQIGKLIRAGHVAIAGTKVKSSQLINGDENFLIVLPKRENKNLVAQAIPLDILFNDDHLAIINKPAGLVVHPGAGVKDGTLCNALLHYFPHMSIGNVERPGIIHRLDRETTGIMVVAKTDAAHQILSDDFKQRRVKKTYRAFCFGELSLSRFTLRTGHARHPYHRLRFFTGMSAPTMPSPNIRIAHTDFEVINRRYGISELRAILHTGRTHQIRAHLADIDHALLGDDLYGGRRPLPKTMPKELGDAILKLTGQALHAESLSFYHPITKQLLEFSAPLPKTLADIQKLL